MENDFRNGIQLWALMLAVALVSLLQSVVGVKLGHGVKVGRGVSVGVGVSVGTGVGVCGAGVSAGSTVDVSRTGVFIGIGKIVGVATKVGVTAGSGSVVQANTAMTAIKNSTLIAVVMDFANFIVPIPLYCISRGE